MLSNGPMGGGRKKSIQHIKEMKLSKYITYIYLIQYITRQAKSATVNDGWIVGWLLLRDIIQKKKLASMFFFRVISLLSCISWKG